MEKLGLNLGYLLVQIGSFFILMVILRAWVYKPILGLLEKRRTAIAQGLEDARIAAEARQNAEKEAGKILADAQLKASQVVREATDRAESAGKEIISEAETEAAKKRAAAQEASESERERILADLRGQVAALAMAVAQKIVATTLDEQRQHALINEFFSGVKSGRVLVLEGENLPGGAAEITSALPLTPEEKETIKTDILSKMGQHASITFRVNPNILGGLIIRIGDKVVDGSISGQMESLRQSLY